MFSPDRILFEDNHLLVVNKLPGELVQRDRENTFALEDQIKIFLKEKYQKSGNVFLGVVHRLDRPTSGVLVFAKTSKALVRLNMDFKTRSVKKIYWAVVENKPHENTGHLVHYLLRNARTNTTKVFKNEVAGSKRAELMYNVVGKSDRYYLIEIELLTGRHHQIRAQLAAIGCSIKGDLKYGAKRSNSNGGIYLHAREITLLHPVKKELVTFVAPTPPDVLWNLFSKRLE